VIRGGNLPNDRIFHDDDFVFVREEKADQLMSNTAYPGDLVFTQRGTLGQVGLIPTEARFPRYIVSQSQMKLTVDPGKADARFVFYYFRHPDTVQSIKNRASSSGVPHINLGVLRQMELPLPSPDTQKEIVRILATYDDLIENNRRRMTLIEESARLLYREWFVRLRFPGHEHKRIVNGVPEGWERRTLGDAMTLKRGYDLPESHRKAGDVPVVSSSGITGFHSEKRALAPGIVTGRYGTLGEVFFVQEDFWPLNTALYVSDFKGNPPAFAAHLLRTVLGGIQSDKAAVPGLDRNVVHQIQVLLPPKLLRAEFSGFATPIYQQIRTLGDCNAKLKAARDLLLPRLMSGQIPM
jgi:type I restriction enzyme S subunit